MVETVNNKAVKLASKRKGIVLAGGLGSRLYPLTKVVSKQLLPVYDKPIIFYSLSTLLLAGIRDIAIITTPQALTLFQDLLGDGNLWGIKLTYIQQSEPNGIAEALILAEDHIAGNPCALVLGDNIFFGNGLTTLLLDADSTDAGATIFSYRVSDPSSYGIVEFGESDTVLSLEEKPLHPKSHFAATGLYFYDEMATNIAKNIKPSDRGELEITAVNAEYLKRGKLHAKRLHRGFAWFDTGTIPDLMAASEFVRQIEERQGLKIGCPEEIVFKNGWIDEEELDKLARSQRPTDYNKYLMSLIRK